MAKSIKLQILCMCLLFTLVLVFGYIGIYALQRTQEIEINYDIYPNAYCQIDFKDLGVEVVQGDGFEKIFCNYNEKYANTEVVSLNEGKCSISFNNRLSTDFQLRITNYNRAKLFVKAESGNVTSEPIIINAYSGEGAGITGILDVSVNALMETINYEMDLVFLCVEDNYITTSFTNCQFDLDFPQSNIVAYNNQFYIAKGDNLNAKLVLTNGGETLPNSISVSIGGASPQTITGGSSAVNGITYNSTTGIITIANANLTGTVEITAIAE